jgi:hypothetical protein
MEYIKDNMGRFIGTSYTNGSKTTTRDFKSGNIVATYDSNSNKTTDWKNNKFVNGNQSTRFLK